jgi:hypothetical protein
MRRPETRMIARRQTAIVDLGAEVPSAIVRQHLP